MQRYGRLYLAFAKNSFLNALEYRLSFTVWSIATICYAVVYVASIQIIFGHVQTIGGWRVEQMLVLAATVMIVDGIVESIFGENMNALSGLINRGELDFVLEQAGEHALLRFDSQVRLGPAGAGGYRLRSFVVRDLACSAQPIAWHGVLALPRRWWSVRMPDCLFALV